MGLTNRLFLFRFKLPTEHEWPNVGQRISVRISSQMLISEMHKIVFPSLVHASMCHILTHIPLSTSMFVTPQTILRTLSPTPSYPPPPIPTSLPSPILLLRAHGRELWAMYSTVEPTCP